MDTYFFYNDNLAAVSIANDISLQNIADLTAKSHILEDNDNLGDYCIFKDIQNNSWVLGRLIPFNPEESRELSFLDLNYYKFPDCEYLYLQTNTTTEVLYKVIEDFKAKDEEFNIILPPIVVFPEGLPTEDQVYIEIWIATDAEIEDDERRSKIAKTYRGYSFNFVKAFFEFQHLAD